MEVLSNRLARYSALAAVIPAAGASAAVIGNPSLNLVLNGNENAFVDFGPGFGEIFRFEMRTAFSNGTHSANSIIYSTGVASQNPVFQFNGANAAGFGNAGEVSHSDPDILVSGSAIGSGRFFYSMNPGQSNTFADLAREVVRHGGPVSAQVTTTGSSYGAWLGGKRGFLGFKISNDFGNNYFYGWFDVETVWDQRQLIIHAWALNTERNQGIDAGEIPAPGAAGLAALALGAAGVRRQRRAQRSA